MKRHPSRSTPGNLLRYSPRPLDRNHRPALRPAPAAPEAGFEVENLDHGAQPGPDEGLRRQQRDVVAGSAIDLDRVAPPYMPSRASEAAGVDPNQRTRQRRETMFAGVGSAIRCDGSPFAERKASMLKTLMILFGLLVALSACAPYATPDTDTVHLPIPGLFTTDPGITRRTPVNMARCNIEACFGFDGPRR